MPEPLKAVDDGVTALIMRGLNLKDSKQAMTAKEIHASLQEQRPGVTLATVLKTLSRLRKKAGSGLARRGKRGEYKYWIREVSAA